MITLTFANVPWWFWLLAVFGSAAYGVLATHPRVTLLFKMFGWLMFLTAVATAGMGILYGRDGVATLVLGIAAGIPWLVTAAIVKRKFKPKKRSR